MTYPDSMAYPMATSRHVWLECIVLKDLFYKMANNNQTEAQITFEQYSNSFGEPRDCRAENNLDIREFPRSSTWRRNSNFTLALSLLEGCRNRVVRLPRSKHRQISNDEVPMNILAWLAIIYPTLLYH